MAEDVCQAVFVDLARKAHALPADRPVAGWLYQHACFVAATTLRAEQRRHRREEIAMHLQSLTDEADWSRLAPVLDDALLDLPAPDRDALVQRFFEQRQFADVGARLGLSENAARMRVDRALDKLRARLAKRGVTSTASALAAALAGPAVTAAPATLGATVTTAALAAATTTSTFGLLSIMASTKLKLTVAAVLVATVATSLVVQHRSLRQQTAENARLRERLAQTADQPSPSGSAAVGNNAELARRRAEHDELLRLRGEVARHRSESARTAQPAARPRTKPAARSETPGLVSGYQLFESAPLGEHHVDAIKTMKLVGRELHRLARGIDALPPEVTTAPLSADGQPAEMLKQSLSLRPPDWGQFELAAFEILVLDLMTMKRLVESKSDAIVTRSKEELTTPDGRLLRIYGKADGSVLNLVHDSSTKALEFGDTPVLPP